MDLQSCFDGDEKAWQQFAERHAGLIQQTVARTLAVHGRTSEADVLDAVQETFLRLIKDDYHLLKRYDPAAGDLRTWLAIVARSTALNWIRGCGKSVPLHEHPAQSTAQAQAASPDVTVPLDLLSPRQRLVLKLLFDDGQSVAECARMLGVDEQTVRSMRHKALSTLRTFFGVRPHNARKQGDVGS